MNRSKRANVAKETLEIIERGHYTAPSGARVDIASDVSEAVSRSKLYTPEALAPLLNEQWPANASPTCFQVHNETSLAAATRYVVEQGIDDALCLNFASAKNPGGGFLGGSQAQEESLARSTALYPTLLAQREYYDANRAFKSVFYTDHMIYSPQVPVFRDDDGGLLESPYRLSFLTAPAVNAGRVDQGPDSATEIRLAMQRRVAMVLSLAAKHRYSHLVLGAWGCGVFRNDPAVIAELFAESLTDTGAFASVFSHVTFAVLDREDEKIIAPFKARFDEAALPRV